MMEPEPDPVEIEVYPRVDGKFDWRKVARRGNLPDETTSNSANQGFNTRSDARKAAEHEHPGIKIINVFSEQDDADAGG